MTTHVGAHLILGFVLASGPQGALLAPASTLSVVAPAAGKAASSGGEAAPATGKPKSSSWWLRAGEAREQQGEYAKAGDAYRQALGALPADKQRANEGARAAMLSADAYWRAFDRDPDPAHLDAGLAALEQWLTLAGPQSRASLLGNVQRMVARIKAVRDPLVEAEASLAAGDANAARGRWDEVLDALASQEREWSVGARIVLGAGEGLVAGYDAKVKGPADVEAHVHELRAARDLLARSKGERPADDASEQGPAVERTLADVQARLDRAEQALADEAQAEAQRRAAEAAAKQREEEAARAKAAETAATDGPAPSRVVPIVLLSTGIVALGAGAGLLGEGAAFTGVAKDRANGADARADALQDMYGEAYERERFDAALTDYREDARRRNLGMIIGGSVLAAGGIALSVVGIVQLAKGRRSPAAGGTRARLAPLVSPTQLQLSISGRF